MQSGCAHLRSHRLHPHLSLGFWSPFSAPHTCAHPPFPLHHPENHGPDLPFSQPAAPNPAKPPAEELTEFFYLITRRGRYITGTVSAGGEDAPAAHPSPSHPARTHLLPTAGAREGQGGLGGTREKQRRGDQRKFKRRLVFINRHRYYERTRRNGVMFLSPLKAAWPRFSCTV